MEKIKRTVVLGKRVILLTGTHDLSLAHAARKPLVDAEIEAPEKLLETARRNPDAVAFGYVSGHWVAAA